jgi:hypothetical protein
MSSPKIRFFARDGYERAMSEKFTSVIKEMKSTGETKSLVVMEQDYLNHLSEKFHKAHLTSCVGKRLFMKKTNGVTIYVLVIVSYHNCWRSYSQSIETNQQYCRLNRRLKADACTEGRRR